MKCQICGKKVNNDNSYGYYSFLICQSCHNRLAKNNPKKFFDVMNFIFECGKIREEAIAKKGLQYEH